jgi:hypothetical protein
MKHQLKALKMMVFSNMDVLNSSSSKRISEDIRP